MFFYHLKAKIFLPCRLLCLHFSPSGGVLLVIWLGRIKSVSSFDINIIFHDDASADYSVGISSMRVWAAASGQ